MISRIILFLFAFSASFQLISQEEWTLDDCIQYAYENNIELKQEEIKVTIQRNQLIQSKFELLPSFNLRTNYTNRFGRSVDPLTYEFTTNDTKGASFSAYTGVDLFRGFRGINKQKKTRIDLEQNLANFEQAKNDLALVITREFLQILYYKELVKVTDQELETTRLQLEQTQKLVDAGALTQGDLLEMHAVIAMEELDLVDANNLLFQSLLNLALLLEVEDPNGFQITQPGISTLPDSFPVSDINVIYDSSAQFMPYLKSAQLGILSAQKDLQINKSYLSPSLSLTSGWGTGYSDQILDLATGNMMPIRDQFDFASTTYLGFSLQIPLFNGLSGYTRVKDAQLMILNAQLELEAKKNQLRKDIQMAYADAKASHQKYKAILKSLEALQLAFENVSQKYHLGMLTALDYNTAKNNLLIAQSELLQAKYSFLFNRKILNFYKGINP